MDDHRCKKLRLFSQLKRSTLNKEDLSRKGSIDEPIRPLVELINRDQYYYTTSTCSGRITLAEKPLGKSNIKKGNRFLHTSHESMKLDELVQVVDSYRTRDEQDSCEEYKKTEKCLWFKFEPFIMHIQCFDLRKAKSLLDIGLASGCRNSGITIGKLDKFMVALRSTSSMEVPIHCDTRFDVANNFIEFLCDESERRMSDNSERLQKLQGAIESFLEHEQGEEGSSS